MKKPFQHNGFIKSDDWIFLQQDIGKALFSRLLPPKYALWVIRFFEFVKQSVQPTLTIKDTNKFEFNIMSLLAEMEILFPVYLSAINFHILVHLPTTLWSLRPSHGHHIFFIERLNRFMKAAVKAVAGLHDLLCCLCLCFWLMMISDVLHNTICF